jgi:hypothetical protein
VNVEEDAPAGLEGFADRGEGGVGLVMEAGEEERAFGVEGRPVNGGGEEVGDEDEQVFKLGGFAVDGVDYSKPLDLEKYTSLQP